MSKRGHNRQQWRPGSCFCTRKNSRARQMQERERDVFKMKEHILRVTHERGWNLSSGMRERLELASDNQLLNFQEIYETRVTYSLNDT